MNKYETQKMSADELAQHIRRSTEGSRRHELADALVQTMPPPVAAIGEIYGTTDDEVLAFFEELARAGLAEKDSIGAWHAKAGSAAELLQLAAAAGIDVDRLMSKREVRRGT